MDKACTDCGVPVHDGPRCRRCGALARWARDVERKPLARCKRCRKEINATRNRRRATYCSMTCRNADPASRPGRSLNQVTKICPGCSREFSVPASNASRYNYCSKQCSWSHRGRDAVCRRCGGVFRHGQAERRLYCSEACRRPPVLLECANCKTTFRTTPSEAGKRRYCSNGCYRASNAETGIEKIVRETLEASGLHFNPQAMIGPWSVDFLVGERLVIEADGLYWHNKRRHVDVRKTADLRDRGYTVWRLQETSINRPDFPARLHERLARHATLAVASS